MLIFLFKRGLPLRNFLTGLFFLALSSPSVFAQQLPPTGSSAEIVEKRAREEVQKELVAEKPPEKVEPEVERPREAAGAARFFARRIHLRPHPTVPPEAVKTLGDFREIRPLFPAYEGREVSFDDLSGLGRKIEEYYRKRGYIALVYTPPQRIEKGEVTLEILLARMGVLHVEGGRWFWARKTRSYWKIPPGKILRYDKIQAGVQAMNENPDRQVRPILKAGKEQGATDVYLKVQDRFPLHLAYSFDNQGVKLTGKERTGFTFKDNNFLALDDIFTIGTLFGNDFGALILQHVVPLSSLGTRFVWGFSHAQVVPKKEFESLGINGISQTYSLALRQRLLARERIAAEAYGGFDFKEKRTRVKSVTTNWDRLRVLSYGGNLQAVDTNGSWMLGQDFYLGFSPHGNGFALTSRRAETRFFKYAFSLTRRHKLPYGIEGKLHFEGQLSPNKLPPQEEMIFGGAGTVRGYPESDYLGDQGILTNTELLIPLFFLPASWKLPYETQPLRRQIKGIGFLDHGYGRLRDPSENERRSRKLLGIGGGFAVAFRSHVSARFEWGVALSDDPLTEAGHSQFHFRLSAEV